VNARMGNNRKLLAALVAVSAVVAMTVLSPASHQESTGRQAVATSKMTMGATVTPTTPPTAPPTPIAVPAITGAPKS
jgi:hypothetical protein